MAVPSWATLVAVICLGLPHGVVMGKSDVEKKLLDIDPSNYNDPHSSRSTSVLAGYG